MYDQKSEENISRAEKITERLSAAGRFLYESIEAVVVALALSVVLYLFLITPHTVLGRSMFPTYKDREYLLANKVIYKIQDPKRGDVIILRHSDTEDFIKRIIGLPGEKISLMNGKVLINGKELTESTYLDPSIYTNGESFLREGGEYTVRENEFFVIGDNRNHSSDSREFGPIKREDIKGKAWVVYFPFNQFRFIQDPNYPA